MHPTIRLGYTLTLAAAMFAAPAFGQIDLAGEWTPQFHEDQPERIPEQLRGRHTLR